MIKLYSHDQMVELRELKSFAPRWEDFVSGSVAGMASLLVCHPLDTIRTRMQVNLNYKGPIDCFQHVVREGGVRALYNGMMTPFLAQGLYKAIIFSSFNATSSVLASSSLFELAGTDLTRECLRVFSAGFVSGVANSFVVTPVELIRNRLMVQQREVLISSSNRYYYAGVGDMVQRLVREEGVSIFWKGISSTMLRDGFGVGSWFLGFTLCKRVLQNVFGWDGNSAHTLMVSGGVGGVSFWIVALPFDTIKSRIQTTQGSNVGIRSALRGLSVRDLYKSLGVSMLRGIPGASIVFYVQKRTKDMLLAANEQI